MLGPQQMLQPERRSSGAVSKLRPALALNRAHHEARPRPRPVDAALAFGLAGSWEVVVDILI